MKVFVPIKWRSPEAEFGTTLVFDSIRTGFPTAEIHVVSSGSIPEAAATLRELTAKIGGTYWETEDCEHGKLMNDVLRGQANAGYRDPLIFVDGDVVFWANCEGFTFPDGKLYAGWFMPEMVECGARQAPRLHCSFLWITDPVALRDAIDATGWFYTDPFKGHYFRDAGEVRCYDEGANLYSMLPEMAFHFTEEQFVCYDHLFLGTLSDVMTDIKVSPERAERIREAHRLAKEDRGALRGYWRKPVETPLVRSSWYYCSALLKDEAGKYWGLSVAIFEQGSLPRVAHVGVTDVENQTFGSEIIHVTANPWSDTLLALDGDTISLRLDISGKLTKLGRRPRGKGMSHHEVGPSSEAHGTLAVAGVSHSVSGPAWEELEDTTFRYGMPWTWASLRLDRGQRLMVYNLGADSYSWRWDGKENGETNAMVWAREGGGWNVNWGSVNYILRPVTPSQWIDDKVVTGMRYWEGLCTVETTDGDRRGWAYVEDVPEGWGVTKPPQPNIVWQEHMYLKWCAGNREAARMLTLLGHASQVADDFADGDVAKGKHAKASHSLLEMLLLRLPGNAFYQENRASLEPFLLGAIEWWDASNEWATNPKRETRMFSYVHREVLDRVIWWVAVLCGGIEHGRKVIREVHDFYHGEHGVESFEAWEREALAGR